MPLESHVFLCIVNPFAWATLIELPVFKPNQYFLDNHVQENEEPVDAYMRVIRKIVCEVGDL